MYLFLSCFFQLPKLRVAAWPVIVSSFKMLFSFPFHVSLFVFCQNRRHRSTIPMLRRVRAPSVAAAVAASAFAPIIGRRTMYADGSPFGETEAMLEFKKYCTDHNVREELGVHKASFLSFLESNGLIGGERTLRQVGGLKFKGQRVFLPAVHSDPVARYHPAMARLAAELPRGGATQAEVKEMLATLAPGFLPSVRGLLTFNEAMAMFPDLFYIGSKVNQWSLKPRPNVAPPLLESQAPNPHQVELESMMRQALASHRKKHNVQGTHWVDCENLVVDMQEALKKQGRSEDEAWGPDHWVSRIMQLRTLEYRGKLLIKPRWKPRGAHLLVDADGVGGEASVSTLADQIMVDLQASTLFVARQQRTDPVTSNDIVVQPGVPTYMVLERGAQRLKQKMHVVLKDVVIMCADHQFETYRDNFCRAVPFPDAEVFIVSPERQVMISSWRWPEKTMVEA